MKKASSYISLSELSRQFGVDRARAAKLLEDLPFKTGRGGSHLYDRDEAIKRVKTYGREMQQMRELRLEKLKAEAELAKQKANDYARTHITLDAHQYTLETFWKHIVNAYRERSEDNYPEQVRTEFRVEAAVIQAMEDMDFPPDMIKQRREDLHRRQGQFDIDLKAGKIPIFWAAEGTIYDDTKGYRVYKNG